MVNNQESDVIMMGMSSGACLHMDLCSITMFADQLYIAQQYFVFFMILCTDSANMHAAHTSS